MAKARKYPINAYKCKYTPDVCQKLIDHMSAGYSFSTFASTISVTRESLYNWVNMYEEFAIAKDIAFACRAKYFEQKMLDGIQNGVKMGAAPLIIFGLKNLGEGFAYTDKTHTEITGKIENDVSLIPVFGEHTNEETV